MAPSTTSPAEQVPRGGGRQTLKRGLTLVVGIGILLFLLSVLDWQTFGTLLGRLSPLAALAAFLIYVALNFFRAMRYRTLLQRPELPASQLFPISLYHNLLVRILPFKLGELTYIYLMRRRLDVPVSAGVSSLFGSRILELLVIVVVALGTLLVAGGQFQLEDTGLRLLILVTIVVGVVSIYYSALLARWGAFVARRVVPGRFGPWIGDKLMSLAEQFAILRKGPVFVRGVLWSLCTYGCSFGVNLVLLMALGIELTVAQTILIVSLGMFATAFPFSISGFGMIELGWAFGLTTLATYGLSEATAIGFLLNGFQVLCAVVSGGIAYLVLQRSQPQRMMEEVAIPS